MWNGMCTVFTPRNVTSPCSIYVPSWIWGHAGKCASSQMLHKLAGKPLSFMHVRVNELIAKHFIAMTHRSLGGQFRSPPISDFIGLSLWLYQGWRDLPARYSVITGESSTV